METLGNFLVNIDKGWGRPQGPPSWLVSQHMWSEESDGNCMEIAVEYCGVRMKEVK